jgi:hypothetical protein
MIQETRNKCIYSKLNRLSGIIKEGEPTVHSRDTYIFIYITDIHIAQSQGGTP